MKSNIFKKAHKLTKEIIRKGDSYKATFRLCLTFVYSQIKKGVNKMVELKGTEKQIKWANDIRAKFLAYVEIFEEDIKDRNDENIKETQDAINKIKNIDSAKFYIDNMKSLTGYNADYKLELFKERNKTERIDHMWVMMVSLSSRI